MTPTTFPTRTDRAIALATGLLAIAIASTSLAGWITEIEILKSVWPGGALMTPNTAFGLMAGGLSVILSVTQRRSGLQPAIGIAVSVFGLMFLLEYWLRADFGVDNLVLRDPASFLPGRPSIATSSSFVALGLALALIPAQGTVAQILRSALAIGGMVLAMTGILGYFISPVDPTVHRVLFGFALPTAIAFLFLSFGVLAAGRRRIALNEFVSLAAPVLSLLAFGALVATSLFAIDAQHKYRDLTRKTEDVELSLSHLLDAVRDAETSQRGYLLTGLESYLEPYRAAAQREAKEFAAIEAMLGHDEAAKGRLAEIHALAQEEMAELDRPIALQRSGDPGAAVATVATGLEKNTMDRLRAALMALQDEEFRQASEQSEKADRQIVRLQFTTLLTVSLVVALAAFLFLDGRRRFENMRRTQRQLASLNANLDRNVAAKTAELSMALNAARNAEEHVRELNARLEELVQARTRELDRIFHMSSDMLGVGDFDGRLIRISPACAAITGRSVEQALAEPALALVHPEDRDETLKLFAKNIRGLRPVNFVNRCLRDDGGIRWLSWRITPMLAERLFYFVARDVTEERHREEIVRQAHKMEAVGQLTGGIAHDFNNLLTIIIGNLDSLQRGLTDAGPRARRQIEHALIGANKAAALVRRMLAFSRRQPLAPENIEVNALVNAMSEMLRRTLGETIFIDSALSGGMWRTEVDPNQLESAILNLAINARDAMPKGGRITIATANARLDERYVETNPDARIGQYVMIAVTDTGEGMSPEVLGRVFEPFFTTKPPGAGTGLGLSQVYGFIQQSGGHISIHSEPGVGTKVKLYLPRSEAVQGPAPAPRSPAAFDARARGEFVLVVEDEDDVRQFAVDALDEAGYRVAAAADGPAALSLLAEQPDIDIMVSDVVLGGLLDGGQLRDAALKLRPGLPVLFMTGYTRDAIMHNGRLDVGVNLLTKPFAARDLTQKVRQLLDARDSDQLKLI
jgi:PAS domain S-box-containing protein